jgi:hypothetical protein
MDDDGTDPFGSNFDRIREQSKQPDPDPDPEVND